jgi:predicted alpha/beta-hydrolase family hydrolase
LAGNRTAAARRRCSRPTNRISPPGLLLFSYPLHPPGRPDRLRTEHFPRLQLRAVFVQGTADPFGTVSEIGSALSSIPAPTQLIAIEGAGHDLKRGRFDLAPVVAALIATS